MITKLYLNIWKNLKNIFRSWMSMALLIIGPLIIIAILALAFSSSGFRNVKIGYVNEANFSIQEITKSLEYGGDFVQYTNIERCTTDLKKQVLHGCMFIKLVSSQRVIIEAQFDNSREILSIILMQDIKRAVLEKQNLIVESTTQGMLTEMGDLSSFMDEGEKLLYETIQDLKTQKEMLEEVNDELQNSKNQYDNSIEEARTNYYSLKTQSNTISQRISNALENTREEITETTNRMYTLNNIALGLNQTSTSNQIIENINILTQTNNELYSLQNQINTELSSYKTQLNELEEVIQKLEDGRQYFTKAIQEINNLITNMASKIIKITNAKNKLAEENKKIKEISTMGTEKILHPLEFEYTPLFTGSKRIQEAGENTQLTSEKQRDLLNYGETQILFPLIICLLVCFIAVILANIIVLEEIYSPAYFRSFLLPVQRQIFTTALFITSFIIMFLQIMVLLLVAHYSFYLDIMQNLPTILPIVILIGLIFSLYGMIIAYAIKNKTTSILACIFVIVITFILSGALFPIERMSLLISTIAANLPFTITVSMLQQSIFYNIPLAQMTNQLETLLLHFIIAIILLITIRYISEIKKYKPT